MYYFVHMTILCWCHIMCTSNLPTQSYMYTGYSITHHYIPYIQLWFAQKHLIMCCVLLHILQIYRHITAEAMYKT